MQKMLYFCSRKEKNAQVMLIQLADIRRIMPQIYRGGGFANLK